VRKLLTMVTDDVMFMVPGRRPMSKEAFVVAVQARQGSAVDSLAQIKEIEVMGDWAWCRVHLTVTLTPPGGKRTTRSGFTLTVLRKQSGKWRIFRDANLMMEE
jgi:uncharacterized protein (TIGR02246 family)